MSLRTIPKKACFVIPIIIVAVCLSSCSGISFGGSEHASIDPVTSSFGDAEIIATIESTSIKESSGLAVSKCQDNVFWTHNDSGGGPFLYAFNSDGKSLGVWSVPDAANNDWEDIAAIRAPDGICSIYIGDIGDNEQKRETLTVYRLVEPLVSADSRNTSRENPLSTRTAEVLRFKYPNGRNSAEALLVYPVSGEIFVVTKRTKGAAEVFKLLPRFAGDDVQTALKIGDISLPASPNGIVTGGDISSDGKRLVLCDYYAGYEFILPMNAKRFDEIWSQKPNPFDLGPRLIGESVAFGQNSDVVFATTERPNSPLIRVERKK
jgi:hypothetical protein